MVRFFSWISLVGLRLSQRYLQDDSDTILRRCYTAGFEGKTCSHGQVEVAPRSCKRQGRGSSPRSSRNMPPADVWVLAYWDPGQTSYLQNKRWINKSLLLQPSRSVVICDSSDRKLRRYRNYLWSFSHVLCGHVPWHDGGLTSLLYKTVSQDALSQLQQEAQGGDLLWLCSPTTGGLAVQSPALRHRHKGTWMTWLQECDWDSSMICCWDQGQLWDCVWSSVLNISHLRTDFTFNLPQNHIGPQQKSLWPHQVPGD